MKYEDSFKEVYDYSKKFEDIVLMFDGSCSPDKHEGYGYVIMNGEDIIAEGWGYKLFRGEPASNNSAEWKSLQLGFELLEELELEYNTLTVRGDSNMVVMQASKKWKLKKGVYVKTAQETMEKFPELIKKAKFEHVYRELNDYADALSNKYEELSE